MSHDDTTGTFLSGGLKPTAIPIDLPDPDKVTRGTLYRDEREQIWKAEAVLGENRPPTQTWVRVTEVGAEQQRRDQALALVFGTAAFGAAILAFNVSVAVGLDFLWGALLVIGTFTICATFSWQALVRVGSQVVLPDEMSLETPDATPAQQERMRADVQIDEREGWRDEVMRTLDSLEEIPIGTPRVATSERMRMSDPTAALEVSHELWLLRTRHGEAVRLELGADGVEGIEKVLHALANGNFSDACAGAGQLLRGTRFALDSHNPEPTGQ